MHNLIIWTAVAAIVALVVVRMWWDIRRYPPCPTCRHNTNSTRIRLFGKEAVCSEHGKFTPDAESFWWQCLPID